MSCSSFVLGGKEAHGDANMIEQKDFTSTPMPTLMSNDQVAEKLGEAAKLLASHGDFGAAHSLKTLLDGEIRIWDFLWRFQLVKLSDAAAHTLGENHPAITLVREVLDYPWPIGLDESPDDPEDT
jgi:hypothetical protein